jgi:UDP-N-acetyl-alpha-D-muramoyl-L-alanyl-L-glutamate epimerase
VEVNHQFSKSYRAEALMRAALDELVPGMELFSVLRPASELSIARAFARLPQYHHAITSCNRVFRLDPALRAKSWCRDCDKCRFVFLILAPFVDPTPFFGGDMLADESQLEGFALLTATGGNKPFECVGTENESTAALRLLERDPHWRDHVVVRRLAETVTRASDLEGALALSDEHFVPDSIIASVREVLGA